MYSVPKEAEAPLLQTLLFYGLVAQQTRETADNTLTRLESLYERYRSPELGDAIRKARKWRDSIRAGDSSVN